MPFMRLSFCDIIYVRHDNVLTPPCHGMWPGHGAVMCSPSSLITDTCDEKPHIVLSPSLSLGNHCWCTMFITTLPCEHTRNHLHVGWPFSWLCMCCVRCAACTAQHVVHTLCGTQAKQKARVKHSKGLSGRIHSFTHTPNSPPQACLSVWGGSEAAAPRLQAFLGIRQLALCMRHPYIEKCLKV